MRPVHKADNLTTFLCRLSWNLGTLTSWNPLGHSRPVTGLLYLYHGSADHNDTQRRGARTGVSGDQRRGAQTSEGTDIESSPPRTLTTCEGWTVTHPRGRRRNGEDAETTTDKESNLGPRVEHIQDFTFKSVSKSTTTIVLKPFPWHSCNSMWQVNFKPHEIFIYGDDSIL